MAFLLHQLLSESAARYPDKEAIRFENSGMTYAALDEATNRVARALTAAGVRRGDRVALYLHKSLASVVAVFGIMKAGGVYVPLDPNAPAKRHAYITRNCGIEVMVTAANKLEMLPGFFEDGTPLKTLVMLDTPDAIDTVLTEQVEIVSWEAVQALDGVPLVPNGAIETDLAYILYTSGSTGAPKGVMIAHRTIFTFVNWCVERFEVSAEDRITSHAPLHFDLSTFDIYVTIKAGGTIVLIPEKLPVFPSRLTKLLQDERITITYLVPSILSMMVNYGKLDGYDLSVLRIVLFAGEVFPINYLRKLIEKVPHPSYFNLYGPTETNVCTYYEVQPQDIAPDMTVPVPIGIACENIEVFAVGDDGQLVTEIGQAGELWVRGSCVAQGYWGDTEKTADRFVANHFQPHYQESAYRTGDIVTLAADGKNWIYVGRIDHMVKSRGYRIELGEIEAALYAHEQISEAVVVPIPDELIGNRLKGFVVIQDNSELSVKAIQAHCFKYVPRYMIPDIVFVSVLPKTSSGKIDRVALAKQ